jgi:hypothetical protein
LGEFFEKMRENLMDVSKRPMNCGCRGGQVKKTLILQAEIACE